MFLKRGDGITNLDPKVIENVRKAQRALGIKDDGQFGGGTEGKVKEFQTVKKLPATGQIDDTTWNAMFPPTVQPAALGFDFPFTEKKLTAILPGNPQGGQWFQPIGKVLPGAKVTSIKRVAGFLSQCAHESSDFKVLQENLNYSTDGLAKTFPKYFTSVTLAASYAKAPEKIANKVYANRMGNGPETSGDGYRFRGRGLVQLTGKDNYLACSKAIYGDDRLVKTPEILLDKEPALLSATWYWNARGLSALADQGDVTNMTRKINGGDHGLADRARRYNEAVRILST